LDPELAAGGAEGAFATSVTSACNGRGGEVGGGGGSPRARSLRRPEAAARGAHQRRGEKTKGHGPQHKPTVSESSPLAAPETAHQSRGGRRSRRQAPRSPRAHRRRSRGG